MRGELICGCAASLALGACATPAADPRPNVLFILADDLGYGDLSVYNPQGRIRTPHLDRLASEGMRFTDAHSSAAVSTPTRYGLLTGCCPWRGPLKQGVIWTWADPLLTGERTPPAMLREAGYATALVGKWHLGIGFATTDGAPVDRAANGANVDYTQPLTDGPTHHGFDCYYGDDVPNFPPYAFIENDRFTEIPDRPFEGRVPGVPGLAASCGGPWLVALPDHRRTLFLGYGGARRARRAALPAELRERAAGTAAAAGAEAGDGNRQELSHARSHTELYRRRDIPHPLRAL